MVLRVPLGFRGLGIREMLIPKGPSTNIVGSL